MIGNVEDLFKSLWSIKNELCSLERYKISLEQSLLPSGIRYDKDNVKSSPQDPMLKFAEQLSDLEEKMSERAVEYKKACATANDVLQRMPTALYRHVLYLRWIERIADPELSWQKIGERVHYNGDYARKKIYPKAIEEAQEVYGGI